MSRPEALVNWLAFLGIGDCPCEYSYQTLGNLHGISFGKGWVRTAAEPDCPHHGGSR